MKMVTSMQCLLATRACLLHKEDNEETKEGGVDIFTLYVEAMNSTQRVGNGVYSAPDDYAEVIEYLAAKQLMLDAKMQSSLQSVCSNDESELELTM